MLSPRTATREERAGEKGRRHCDTVSTLMKKGAHTWAADVGEITIAKPKARPDGFEVMVVLVRDGVRVPLNNPFVFINPPMGTRDADGRRVEDAQSVLEVIVADAVALAVQG
jgi:hypothetical protein